MNARVAGSFGVPVALATGDDAFTEEIKTLVDGDIETVAVKRHIRRCTPELLHPEEARRQIREGARRAIERLSSLRPTRPRKPVTVAITRKSPDLADIAVIFPTRRAYRPLHSHVRILGLRARVQNDSRSLPQSVRVAART